jgi:pimeloyl-ACP methyl ester carboxylesterase
VREALLVIRGTTEAQDWSINMEEAPVPFVYIPTRTTPPRTDATSAGAATATGGEVCGHVHAGMHKGATGILDCYGLRTALLTLAAKVTLIVSAPPPRRSLTHTPLPHLLHAWLVWSQGYKLTIVGHSLGAGTAVLVAAELHNSLVDIIGDGDGEGNKEPAAAARSVRAMAFACPPVACAALSEAFQRDQVRPAPRRFAHTSLWHAPRDVHVVTCTS